MDCTNPFLGKLLDKFIDGDLSEEMMEKVHSHFLECQKCFKEYQFHIDLMETIRKNKDKINIADFDTEEELEKAATGLQTKTDSPEEEHGKRQLAEEIIRKKLRLSQIRSFYSDIPKIPNYLKDLKLSPQMMSSALEEATHIYALFAAEKKDVGYVHNINVQFEKSDSVTGSFTLLGSRKRQEKVTTSLNNEGVFQTTISDPKINDAVKRGIHSAFCYIKQQQENLGLKPDNSLNLNNLNITCAIEDDDFSILDGESICLAAAIATISRYVDLPTKIKPAFTGNISNVELGKVGGVGKILIKLKQANNSGLRFQAVIIPEYNYAELKKDSPQELDELSINIVPVINLHDAVKAVFDMKKVENGLTEESKKKL